LQVQLVLLGKAVQLVLQGQLDCKESPELLRHKEVLDPQAHKVLLAHKVLPVKGLLVLLVQQVRLEQLVLPAMTGLLVLLG
jgi:hypothetical protein